MILGALLALGVDENELIGQIKLLGVSEFDLEIRTVDRAGISAVHVDVKIPPEHAHRHLHTIEKIINDSGLSETVKKRAIAIFTRLAEAEAKIHGIDVQKVHFHEVGAMDAIIDVVGACVGFEMLGIENFACSKIHVGSGFAQMAHGKFPIPPPAVAELLRNAPVYSTEIEGELITPTGAAIISTVCEAFGKIPEMKIQNTAYGAGTREYKNFPNALRLILGEVENRESGIEKKHVSDSDHRPLTTDHLILLETNIDDLSPQILGFVMERAFKLGASDCWFTPIQMKKNRPATMLSILCEKDKREVLTEMLFRETSTIGLRARETERICLARRVEKIETRFGEIDVKIAGFGGETVNVKPEFDQLKAIAERENLPLRQIEAEVLKNLKND